MREMTLKLKMHGTSIINNDIEKLILNIIFWSFLALALWYVFILGNMVFDIVERRALEADVRVLGNEVGDLELRYLAISNNIDLYLSHSLGFKEVKANFATRKPLGILPTVKLAANEI